MAHENPSDQTMADDKRRNIDRRLVFLVGAPRSGTTWLQLMLSSSPYVASGVETHLFSVYESSLFSSWKKFEQQESFGLRALLSEDEYFELVHDFSWKILKRIGDTTPHAKVLIEKTPDHVLCWQEILKMFPQAGFIHLIRDPRAVVASLNAASQTWAGEWESPTIQKSCEHWIENVTAGMEISNATRNYVEVRYRDLLIDGVPILQSLFKWCGIDHSYDELERIYKEHKIEQLRSGETSGLAAKYATRGPDFFRKGEIESWRSDLTRRQVAVIERMAGELMDQLGYARAASSGSIWSAMISHLSVRLAWLAAGLAWRTEKLSQWLSRRG